MARYAEQVSDLITLLEHMRLRPGMYFGEVAVEPATHFLNGWHLALSAWLGEGIAGRRAVEAERGWPVTAHHPSHHMVERGLTPAEVIDELLVIEIETLRKIVGR